ncbi:MAG: glycosyltransferase family 2 protein [Paracoccaceae bacterium]
MEQRYSILSTMKNEGPFILEWIAHYKELGFDSIFVATNDCEDPTVEILQRLQEIGLVQHHATAFWPRSTPHKAALRQLQGYREVKNSDWIFVCDVDEFLVVKVGDGSVRALVAASGDADVISVPWRIFGSSGITNYRDAWITEQFLMAEPTPQQDRKSARRAKSIFHTPRRFQRYGIHQPIPKDEFSEQIHSVLPGGMPASEWKSRNFDIAQLNHYALRSRDSFQVKKARGRAHHVKHELDDSYWKKFDRNHMHDESIARYASGVRSRFAQLMADTALRTLHHQAVAWHRDKIRQMQADA